MKNTIKLSKLVNKIKHFKGCSSWRFVKEKKKNYALKIGYSKLANEEKYYTFII